MRKIIRKIRYKKEANTLQRGRGEEMLKCITLPEKNSV